MGCDYILSRLVAVLKPRGLITERTASERNGVEGVGMSAYVIVQAGVDYST
jgi:hypothetical protein